MLIDVHAHLTDPAFSDLPEVIRRAKAAGVAAVVTSITDPADLPKAKSIIEQYGGYVFLTVGWILHSYLKRSSANSGQR